MSTQINALMIFCKLVLNETLYQIDLFKEIYVAINLTLKRRIF